LENGEGSDVCSLPCGVGCVGQGVGCVDFEASVHTRLTYRTDGRLQCHIANPNFLRRHDDTQEIATYVLCGARWVLGEVRHAHKI